MITLGEIKSLIINSDNIAIICHVSPDCDTIGSGLAFSAFLKKLGKTRVDVYCEDEYRKLAFITSEKTICEDVDFEYDLAIAVDVATGERMGEMRKYYYRAKKHFTVDHHKSNDMNASELYLRTDVSSTAEIIYTILSYIDSSAIDKNIAELLYAGILTDSGAFYHPSTTSNTHSVVAKLYEYDIDSNKIYYELFKKIEQKSFALQTNALNKTSFYCNGEVGILTFLKNDFDKFGTDYSSTEGCINKLLDVDIVKVAVSVAEVEKNSYKVSFRSKGNIDVSSCAARFGGGGHKNAAGCRINGNYYDIIDKLVFVVKSILC